MKKVQKKFTVKANEDILRNTDIYNIICAEFGQTYKRDLDKNKPIPIEFSIVFDSPTRIQIRPVYEVESSWQDLIMDIAFSNPKNNISQVIVESNTSGIIEIAIY